MSYPCHCTSQLYIGEAFIGTVFGIIIGPHGANIFDPRSWGTTPEEKNRITLEFMRIVLATGLFAIGIELPRAYLKEHARSLLIMVCFSVCAFSMSYILSLVQVVPTMAFGWLVSGGACLSSESDFFS